MSKTAQEIAREALAAQAKETWADDAAAYFNALSEIAALPVSAPFALPVSNDKSVRVSAVDVVECSVGGRGGVELLRYLGDCGDVIWAHTVHPPYAAAWLAAFNVPEKEESK